MALPSNGSAAEPKRGKWKGKTEQGKRVEFTVKRKGGRWKVTEAEFRVKVKCESELPSGDSQTDSSFRTFQLPARNTSGEVTDGNYYDQHQDLWSWRTLVDVTKSGLTREASTVMQGGFLSRRKAKGFAKYTQKDETKFGPYDLTSKCKSGRVRWTAKKK